MLKPWLIAGGDGGYSMLMERSTETLTKRFRIYGIPVSVEYWVGENAFPQERILKILSGLHHTVLIKSWREDRLGILKSADKTSIWIDEYDKKVLLDECDR